jgi:hypothetical protein
MAFNDTISQLTGSSTFYDWFIKENSEIIAKLNQATVSGVTAIANSGIGVSFNSSSGLVQLFFGGTASSNINFLGTVNFSGETNFPSNSFRITGITVGTPGYTFGMPVYINSSGYTTSIANSPDSAEVVGMLSSLNSSYSVVTTNGYISGNFQTIAGSTLSPGCIYFLSPSTGGYITTTEPTTLGQVSKPVLIGLGATSGVVIQYRGNYLNSSLSGGGESGSHRLYIPFTTTPTDPRTYGFTGGMFLSYAPHSFTDSQLFNNYLVYTGRTAINGWFLSGTQKWACENSTYSGLVNEEDFIVGMVESITTSGANLVYQILTQGTSTIIPHSINSAISKRGPWGINGSTYNPSAVGTGITQLGILTSGPGSGCKQTYQLGYVFDTTPTYWYVNPRPLAGYPATVSFTSTSDAENLTNLKNHTFNGNFAIWQRNTGKTQYTSTGSVYFADNWIRRLEGIPSGSSQYIERQSFNVADTYVEGNPEYYVNFKCVANPTGADPSGASYSVGHVIDEIETFNGSSTTITFYAKCSQSNYTADVYFARYANSGLISKEIVGSVNLQTSWTKHTVNYDVDALSAGSYLDDYVEVGLDLMPVVNAGYSGGVAVGTGLYVSLASLCVYDGTYTAPKHMFLTKDEQLKLAQKYFYSTYSNSQTIGSATMLSYTDPVLNTYSFNIMPNNAYSVFKLPVQMRETPSVTLYSPYSGLSNEVYNFNAKADLRNTTGTKGYDNLSRQALRGSSTVSTSQDEGTIKIDLVSGFVNYDTVNLHIIADASYPI